MSQEKPDCVIDRADLVSEDGLSSSLQESLMQISLFFFFFFFWTTSHISMQKKKRVYRAATLN